MQLFPELLSFVIDKGKERREREKKNFWNLDFNDTISIENVEF